MKPAVVQDSDDDGDLAGTQTITDIIDNNITPHEKGLTTGLISIGIDA